jgi:hypothetical protein
MVVAQYRGVCLTAWTWPCRQHLRIIINHPTLLSQKQSKLHIIVDEWESQSFCEEAIKEIIYHLLVHDQCFFLPT